MERKEILADIDKLMQEIDKCTDKLIKARLDGIDKELEGKALSEMESLMVGAFQEIAFLYDYINGNPGLKEFPTWKRTLNRSCWSGELGVNPAKRQFQYENYTINADKLFKMLLKDEDRD